MRAALRHALGLKDGPREAPPPPLPSTVEQLITPSRGPATQAFATFLSQKRKAPQLSRLEKRNEAQRIRRAEDARFKDLVAQSPVDLAEADDLVSQLLASPRGKKLVPNSTKVLEDEVLSVKQEVANALGGLMNNMPDRSRFRGSIVRSICSRKGSHFSVEEWEFDHPFIGSEY